MEFIFFIILAIIVLRIAFRKKFGRKQTKRHWTKDDADTLVTTVLPAINNDDLNK